MHAWKLVCSTSSVSIYWVKGGRGQMESYRSVASGQISSIQCSSWGLPFCSLSSFLVFFFLLIAACTLSEKYRYWGWRNLRQEQMRAAGVRCPVNRWQFAGVDVVSYSVWRKEESWNLLKDWRKGFHLWLMSLMFSEGGQILGGIFHNIKY